VTPTVLIIDDDPRQNALVTSLARHNVSARALGPDAVTRDDIEHAHVVLVDLLLDRWIIQPKPDSIAREPRDGLALAAVFRAHLGYGRRKDPTAFALHTGRPDVLAADTGLDLREHGLARVHNLEWVFLKADPGRTAAIASLASAVVAMPPVWPTDPNEAGRVLERLLRLEGPPPMLAQARRDVEETHPPTHELSSLSQGMTALRWMLHRILPYPTFLHDDWQLAARLGVKHESLLRALDARALPSALADARYRGFLADFSGRRWWRAGIEHWVDEISEGRLLSGRELRDTLVRRYRSLESAEMQSPVVRVDAAYRTIGLVDAADAVRISLDDWPPFAEPPWATVADVLDEPALAARVVLDDRRLRKRKRREPTLPGRRPAE